MIDDDLGCNLKHNCQQHHPDDDDGSGRYHHHWGFAVLGNLVIGYSYIIIGEKLCLPKLISATIIKSITIKHYFVFQTTSVVIITTSKPKNAKLGVIMVHHRWFLVVWSV